MEFSKKYYKQKANSILESVIALTIISICFYIAIMIFAAVFTPRTSVKFYNTQNKVNELFYLAVLKEDSLTTENENQNLEVEEEIIKEGLKRVNIKYKDSSQFKFEKSFYVQTNED
jgi:hypothetical protein